MVEDAAGNQSTVLNRTVATENATVSSLGALPGPGTSSGASTASILGPGTPNGTGASASARLELGEPRTISRSFAHRALNLDGRLLNAQGNPIAGATLDVLRQVDGTTTPELIAHASTRSNGTFSVRVPAGPSRLIEVGYRAFSNNAGYAAQATVEESVRAGVQLNVTPRRTSAEGAITLSGTVQGPIPAQGAIVDLLVHYRGRWEPFRTPRTNSHGHFRVVYQFEGGIGRFPFRAEVPAGQTGLPFTHGYSRVIDVATS